MVESTQNKLLRLKPPRTRITHDVETDGVIEKRELPFVVGILADVKGNREHAAGDESLATRAMIDIGRDNFNEIMAGIAPRLACSALASGLQGEAALVFRSIGDFEPRHIIDALPWLSRLRDDDPALNQALAAIMHSASFRKMEATWRGLHYLVFNTETGSMLRLRLLDARKDELLHDLQQAATVEHSALYRNIRDSDVPCSLLIGDHEIDASSADMALLHGMAEVAAALHAPFVAQASPGLLGLDSFTELQHGIDAGTLRSWQAFRENDNARWITLAVPRALLRLPYGMPADASGLWGNPAWLLAGRITRAFALHAWPAAIHGLEGGGLVEPLPYGGHAASAGGSALPYPADAVIDSQLDKELTRLGFATLRQDEHSGKAYLNIPAMLPHLLAASRFAHHLSAMMRARSGGVMSRAEVHAFLDSWLAGHVLLDDHATQENMASHPLRAAAVNVIDEPDAPGSWRATLFLKPQFQLDDLGISIRLAMRLPK